MGENDVTNANGKKSMFTVKKILRALSLLCIVFVFCPSFLVSCSGQNINVSAMTAVGGVSTYGKKVVDSHPIMLVCLLIPVAVLVLLFINKFTEKKTAGIILGCTTVDLVIWFIFRSTVKKLAEENYCSFKTTGWYVINVIAMILIIVLTLLVVINKMEMEADLITVFSGGGTQGALNQMSATMNQMSSVVTQLAGNVVTNISNKTQKENAIGFCTKCGGLIEYGCKFCTSCGTPVPENMLAEAEAEAEATKKAAEEAARKEVEEKARLAEEEAKRKEAERVAAEVTKADQVSQSTTEIERPMFCQNCGVNLGADAVFCESCGTKVD